MFPRPTKICTECKVEFIPTAPYQVYCVSHKNHKHTRYARKLRDKVYDFYGNKCKHCGFEDIRAFQLDHVNGGGTKERRERRQSYPLVLLDAIANPTKYQLLCANCNQIKKHVNREQFCSKN